MIRISVLSLAALSLSAATAIAQQSAPPPRPLRDDFSGSWAPELTRLGNGSSGGQRTVGRLQLEMRRPELGGVQPTFVGTATGLAGIAGLDSRPIHRATLQYRGRDSVVLSVGSFDDTLPTVGQN